MVAALKAEVDVVNVIRRPWSPWFSFLRQAIRRASGGRVDIYGLRTLAELASRRARREIERVAPDFVVAVAVTPIAAHLSASHRVVHVSDATCALMVGYNPRFTKLSVAFKKSVMNIETQCISNVCMALFPSTWAQLSALRDHGGSSSRCHIVPFGANMARGTPISPTSRDFSEIRLLMVGSPFESKGGPVALDTLRILRERGLAAQLDVVGSDAPGGGGPPGAVFHGYVSKDSPEGLDLIRSLYTRAHFFILPTQFEALGIVFAEAASFGLPAISYDTGGVSGMVISGETGILLPMGAGGGDFADAISELVSDPLRYQSMSERALNRSLSVLDWSVWAREASRLFALELADRQIEP
jgi:glycosyltransferase involved in cell wall biosynthesis